MKVGVANGQRRAEVAHTALRRPNKNETKAKTKNTKNKIFATPAALAASPPKPKTAANSAITKNTAAQYNMIQSLRLEVCMVSSRCSLRAIFPGNGFLAEKSTGSERGSEPLLRQKASPGQVCAEFRDEAPRKCCGPRDPSAKPRWDRAESGRNAVCKMRAL